MDIDTAACGRKSDNLEVQISKNSHLGLTSMRRIPFVTLLNNTGHAPILQFVALCANWLIHATRSELYASSVSDFTG